jgi:hypothetical protein
MHTKMLRYSRVVSVSLSVEKQNEADEQELNHKRLRKETFGLCRALEETVKDDTVCQHIVSATDSRNSPLFQSPFGS